MKLDFFQQIFEKILKCKISSKWVQWEPSCSLRTDGPTDMTILILYVTYMMQNSVYQTVLTHCEMWTQQIHRLLTKHVADCVSVVSTCKVGLINRDMTKLRNNRFSNFAKSLVRKSFYVDFMKLKSACFRPVPVIVLLWCNLIGKGASCLVTTECLLWGRAAINMQLVLSCCSRYMF
jgi:hypothetical protein